MRTVTKEELDTIKKLHAKWVICDPNGARADLTDAVLTDADLTDAVLTDADLRGADLRGAVLTRAVLTRAVLTDADLTRAVLTDADLTDADLTRADLTRAVLTPIRDDLWAVLSSSPAEVDGLRAALAEGRIDGSTYEGDCACLVGTLANVRHCKYTAIPTLNPSSSRAAERFFLAISKGDTPETSQFSRLALEWVDQWLANVKGAFCGGRSSGVQGGRE